MLNVESRRYLKIFMFKDYNQLVDEAKQLVKKYNNLLIENAQLKMEKNTFKWGKKVV